MDKVLFIKQLDLIISSFKTLKSKSENDNLSGLDLEDIVKIFTMAKAAVARITGTKSEYYKDIEYVSKTNSFIGKQLKFVIGTVSALKSDLENDYLKSLNDLVQSEVFSDYLEMAGHLIEEGYKDPSAVIIGSTLEAHLRELCKTNEIETEIQNQKGIMVPKKADLMNSDLAKSRVYSSLYQKQITAWLGIRNAAAHGQYSEYTKEEVSLMFQGVHQFITSTK